MGMVFPVSTPITMSCVMVIAAGGIQPWLLIAQRKATTWSVLNGLIAYVLCNAVHHKIASHDGSRINDPWLLRMVNLGTSRPSLRYGVPVYYRLPEICGTIYQKISFGCGSSVIGC